MEPVISDPRFWNHLCFFFSIFSARYGAQKYWTSPVFMTLPILHTVRTKIHHNFDKTDAHHEIRRWILTVNLHNFACSILIHNVFFGTASPPPCWWWARTSASYVRFSSLHPSFRVGTPVVFHCWQHQTFAKSSSWRRIEVQNLGAFSSEFRENPLRTFWG